MPLFSNNFHWHPPKDFLFFEFFFAFAFCPTRTFLEFLLDVVTLVRVDFFWIDFVYWFYLTLIGNEIFVSFGKFWGIDGVEVCFWNFFNNLGVCTWWIGIFVTSPSTWHYPFVSLRKIKMDRIKKGRHTSLRCQNNVL